MSRERLGSRLGFIMLSAGSAIGCGNVWKFPWMVGENGGGAFVLLYIVFLIILGLPVMTMEFAVGRAAQASPVLMYRKLEKPGTKWHAYGGMMLIGNICLMAFYTVVAGWMIFYFVSFLTGNSAALGFETMISSPRVNVLYTLITILLSFGVLMMDLSGGLERIIKLMMVLLLILMMVIAVRSVTLEGAPAGLKFYLMFDFNKVTPSVIVSAMNQAFFSLSVGIGGMAIFGSYINKERSLLGESVNVVLLDTVVALIAGLIIFPSCSTFNLEVTSGPALLFDTMTTVFNHMPEGRFWGTMFFLFMVFAALSTVLSACETILACVREMTGWSRKKGGVLCGIGLFLLSLTTALGFSVWRFRPFSADSTWLDFWDFIVSNNLLPMGAVIISLFCCSSRWGWGWNNFVEEANAGIGLKVRPWMKPVFKVLVPAAILIVYVIGLCSFQWS